MRGFAAGFSAPGRALAFLRRERGLNRYVLVPILVNLLVGAILYWLLLTVGFDAVDDVSSRVPLGAEVLNAILRLVLVLALLVLTGFVIVRFGVVLGAPWYGRLSEEVEARGGTDVVDRAGRGMGRVAVELARAVRFEAQKLLLVVAIALPLLLLNFVPVAGQVAVAVGGTALGCLVACLDFFDGPMERRRRGFRQKLRFVRRGGLTSVGFGLACVLLLSVPVLNLLSIPLCVTAGTMVWSDLATDRAH